MKSGARFVIAFCVAAIGAGAATAQSGGGYDLHWNVRSAGGGSMNGGGYTVTANIGQPASSECAAGAPGRTLRHGFWGGITEGDVIFRNGFDPGC